MARFWCVLLCAVISAILAFLVIVQAGKKRDRLSGSTVKIVAGPGHGSGFHIGNRFVVTAAHVVGEAKTITLKIESGRVVNAAVLWTNEEYDLALLRADTLPDVAVSRLNCDPVTIGQPLHVVGNPGPFEWVHSWGHVSSDARELFRWKLAFMATPGIQPGSSGGPALDVHGRAVGVVVGISLVNLSSMFAAPGPFAIVVPGSAVCLLLARPRNGE
jgi:S1-C subfamily serine protease